MKKFYILYNDGELLEGNISCSKIEFEERIIFPVHDTISVWDVSEDNEWTFNLENSLKEIL